MTDCERYYKYVIAEMNRVKSDKISIHGKMPDECIKYFEDRGISVKKGLFGYIEFRREI